MFLFGWNPLIGIPHLPDRSPHVPGTKLYPERAQNIVEECLPPQGRCHRGVYAYVTGPSFETRAEAQFLRVMGADAVGMSTAPDAIVACHLGMNAGALCCISNTLLPLADAGLSHDSILQVVGNTASGLTGFIDKLVAELAVMV